MRPAAAAIGAAYVVATAAFIVAVIHVALAGQPRVSHIAIMAGACLVAGASVVLAVHARPRSPKDTTAGIYAKGLSQVHVDG